MTKKKTDSEELTLFSEASHANPGQEQESNEGRKMTVTSGLKCYELLKASRPDLDGSLAKMCKALLTWRWDSPARSLIWKMKTTKSNHSYMALSPSRQGIKGNGVSLWPTPRATSRMAYREKPSPSMINGTHGWSLNAAVADSMSDTPHRMWNTPTAFDSGNPNTQEKIDKEATTNRKGRDKPGHLKEEVMVEEGLRMWPTDNLVPTPVANDHKDNPAEKLENWEKRAKKKKEEGINLQFALRHYVQMYPTPTARDYKGARKPETLKKKGRTETNSLPDKVRALEDHRMWPTARAALGMNMKTTEGMAKLRHKGYLETEVAHVHIHEEKKEPVGALNPPWVEWLMGFPIGHTSVNEDITYNMEVDYWGEEPPISRVAVGVKNRKDRLRCLGNAVVPQCLAVIAECIKEVENEENNN